MDINYEIGSISKNLFTQISHASNMGDSSLVQQLSKFLPDIEKIKIESNNIINKIELLRSQIANTNSFTSHKNLVTFSLEDNNIRITARGKAKIRRNEFLNDLKSKGIILKPYKGVVYQNTENEGLVGIAYSCEHYQSWFLGLPDWGYSVVVLLCDGNEGEAMNPIVLSGDFYKEYSKFFSRSHGQIKFNIRKNGENFVLYSKNGNVIVNKFINNLDSFRKVLNPTEKR